MVRDTPTGVELDIRVITRARKTELVGWRDEALVIRIGAPPVEGAANDALIELLSRQLHVPRQSVRILRGEHARIKRIAVVGVTAETIRSRMGH